jgi:plastocyanin
MREDIVRKLIPILLAVAVLAPFGSSSAGATRGQPSARKVRVPEEDRFTPFALTIQVGQSVRWINNDGDDHTVVSDDAFNTAGHKGFDSLLPASGGTLVLRFNHPGTFVYYCRFHATLDSFNQPIAPGPDGGIQDPNGNYGTPMSGVITVVGDDTA